MTTINLSTAIHVYEDTEQNFDVRDILAQAGYGALGSLNISSIQVRLPDNTLVKKDTPLFGMIDADTIYVRPGAWAANYNGNFSTIEVVVDKGDGTNVALRLQVIIDPVNDAPSGANKTFDLADGHGVVLGEADFGFTDQIDGNHLKSVLITTPPAAGQLLLDGVAVAAGAEIALAAIQAGHLVFVPSQTVAGSFDIGFKVRDDGGTVGTNAADLSVAPNYLTFKVPMAHLGDLVWNDANGNGLHDAGEAGVAGVTVQLRDAAGNVVGSTSTDASGAYHFDVDPGTYSVAVVTPAGYSTGTVPGALMLAPGETNNHADLALLRNAALGDRVWFDANNNGVQDAGEAGVAGVAVTLFDAAGHAVGSPLMTDANGNYLFTDLKPGSYSVQFDKTTLPQGYVFTAVHAGSDGAVDSDANVDSGATDAFVLAPGDSNHGVAAGIVALPATLNARVWEDRNGNGVQDAGEAGIGNVTVQLKDTAGKLVETTTTDASGNYHFTVNPGTYSVAVVAPSGYLATVKDAGNNDAADSDIDASGVMAPVVLGAGETSNNLAAGLYQAAEIGARVWLDTNKNGVQDAGEAGIAGVKVTLLDANGNAVGSPVITDADGNYLFTNLAPGNYSVQFDKTTLPASYVLANDPAGGDGGSGQVVVGSGESNHSAGAGANALPATLGEHVWEDKNGNGVQDAGEAGIADVTVQLKDADGKLVGTTTTDASGNYFFTVDPGTYSVAVVAPAGYVATVRDAGANDGIDSDIDAAGNSASVTLGADEFNTTLDAGFYKTAELGSRVWLDTNKNGVQDAGEGGVAGVKVTLLDATGHAVGSPLLTDADGNYLFTNLAPGNYSVQFDKTSLPAGYQFTARDAGTDDSADSDASVTDGSTAQVTLASGDSNHSVAAGVIAPQATLGDRVWEDKNGNGVQDAGENGIKGVTVQLKNAAGAVIGTTATDASGNYSFNVDAGTYSVAVVAPKGYLATVKDVGTNDALDSDIDSTGNSAGVTVAAGQNYKDLDAGLFKGAELGDRVWLDTNKNGVQDAGEAGLAGVKVTLLDATGHAVGSPLLTDANGNYLFTNLAPGSYSVQFDKTSLPTGYQFTTRDAGTNDAKDSDANVTDGTTAQVTLASGDSNHNVAAGVIAPQATLGDRVWEDTNANGIQDAGESGIKGVTVQLKNAAGTVVGTTTTDASGNYSFNVDAGTYSVAVVAPKGYLATVKDAGSNDALDSDIDSNGRSASVTVAAGQNYKDLDAGLYKTAEIGDRIWLDSNGNGIQDAGEAGVSCVKVILLDAAGKQVGSPVVTDDNGNYLFKNLTPGTYSIQLDKTSLPSGYSITGRDAGSNDSLDSDANALDGKTAQTVLDSGESDRSWDIGLKKMAQIGDRVWLDSNANGIQDSGEAGIAGVTVQLKNAAGAVVDTTTTDSSGNYKFAVDAGSYSVAVKAPTNYVASAKDVGSNDAVDSDVDANGNSATFTVAAGETNKSVDAGLYQKASIGDRVWEDKNFNGVQDAGEAGVAGVTVKLLGTNNQLLGTTTTNASGNYLFNNLTPGEYKIEVVKPSGYYATKADVGADSADSDINASTGRSGAITLTSGENDMSVDAGLYRKASIGDKVWRDRDHDGVQDANEEGIGNIKVMLYTSSNQLVGTTYTNDSGNYKFSNLDPGSYYLKFDKSDVMFKGYDMESWKWGVKNVGSNDEIDSDVKGDGVSLVNVTSTDVTFLESGENDMSWDATITPIVIDLNGDGIHTIARADFTGSFDLLGTGTAIQSGWISGNDGFLAVDSNGNGKIDGIGELFGGASKGSGFAKLASFDSNGDGVVDAHDDQFAELRIWRDANSNGATDAGELLSLLDAGVLSLTVGFTELPFLDANNNLHLERSNATLADGKSVDMTDVYFNVDAKDAAKAGVALPSMADLLSDDHALDTVLGPATAAAGVAETAPAQASTAVETAAQADVADLLRRVHAATAVTADAAA